MKKYYFVAGDVFIATAFVAFTVAVVFRLLDIYIIAWNITRLTLFKLSFWCLLFSMALSLIDIARKANR